MKSWIDAAKGIAIWLIVTTHAINEFRALPGFDMHGRTAEIIDFYYIALAPMRLPLFFVLSGALAARAINGSWSALMKRKVWFFFYLFAIWSLVKVVFEVLMLGWGDPTNLPSRMLQAITIKPESTWYLLAIALYFPAAKLLKNTPAWGMSVAVLLTVFGWSSGALSGYGMWSSVIAYLTFFIAGYNLSSVIKRADGWAAPWQLVAALPAALSLYFLLPGGKDLGYTLARFGTSFAAILVCIVLSIVICSRVMWLGRLLAFLGQNTLPIYVTHILWIRAWHLLVGDSLTPNGWQWFPYPFVTAAFAICLSLLFFRATRRVLPFVWTTPGSGVPLNRPANNSQKNIPGRPGDPSLGATNSSIMTERL